MDSDRTTNSNASNWLSPEGELVVMTFAEAERWMLARLQDKTKDRKQALKHLARFYADHRRYDQSLERMRELVMLETDLEEKAACVLATGAIAEKKEDFQAAVQFYREAFAMEPERNDVWFFVNNNLGYSLNKLGQFAEGEKCCRAAVEINPSRPNGHKNLGIALAGQGEHREAAKCFVMATKVNSGDPRSLGLLKQLFQQHPELEFEFQDDLARCEQAVKFAAAAIQRARAGKVLKILLGCNNQDLDEMFLDMFRCMSGGAVETFPTTHWKGFIDHACTGGFDLALVIPNNLQRGETDSADTKPWAFAVNAVKRIKGNASTVVIVSGDAGDVAGHGQDCLDAGADAVIELPFSFDLLADIARRRLIEGSV